MRPGDCGKVLTHSVYTRLAYKEHSTDAAYRRNTISPSSLGHSRARAMQPQRSLRRRPPTANGVNHLMTRSALSLSTTGDQREFYPEQA
jgi:hypothetical protein